MTDRIRWGHDEPGDGVILDGSTGSVGALDDAAFHIWKPPQAGGELVLTSDLPGQQGKRSFGSDPAELKATAERWLSEFVASLGAIFPDFEACVCPCDCPAPGRRDDDGTPGWCDPCRMNIHQVEGAGQ